MYSCNESFVEQVCVSILTLLDNNQDLDELQIHFVEDALTRRSKARIQKLVSRYKRTVVFYPLKKILQGLPLRGKDRHPHTIYSKLFMEFLNIDRLLYLDCDTAVAGSLRELEQAELRDCLVAGVRMPYRAAALREAGQASGCIHICDGVVLIHIRLWRKEQTGAKAAEYIRKNKGLPPMLSEGVLNYVCRGRICLLPPRYNLMSLMILFRSAQMKKVFGVKDYYSESELEQARRHPVIIHYLDEMYQRPWYRNSDHPYRAYYRDYRGRIAWMKPMQRRRLLWKIKLARLCAQYLPTAVFIWLRGMKRTVAAAYRSSDRRGRRTDEGKNKCTAGL